jgi:hypothetical protein
MMDEEVFDPWAFDPKKVDSLFHRWVFVKSVVA